MRSPRWRLSTWEFLYSALSDEYLTALEEERRRREANAQFIYDENIDELDRCEVVPDYPTDQWNAYYHRWEDSGISILCLIAGFN